MKSLLHSAKLLARYGRDRLSHPRGSRLVMGNALVGRLLYSLIRRDVDIVTDTSLAKIVRDADGPRDRRGSDLGRRLARDIASRRADSGGRRFQPSRRAACRARDRRGLVLRRARLDRRCAGQGDRDRRPPQRPGSQRGLLGAGVDPAPRRRIARGVSAFRARPRQAGDAGGRQQRPPLRQRGDLLPPVRAGDAGAMPSRRSPRF